MNSMETGQANFENAFSEKAIRQGFIRKVYALLCCQLLITFTGIILTNLVTSVQVFLVNNLWITIMAMILSIFILIPMLCVSQGPVTYRLTCLIIDLIAILSLRTQVKSLRRSAPTNYILLFSFTICYSFPLSFLGAFYKTDTILIAVVITGIIVVGLTIFAIQTKIDFT